MGNYEIVHDLHCKAWSNQNEYSDYLERALLFCAATFQKGDRNPIFLNDYAAILLELNRNTEALELLKTSEPRFSEYCSNYAIAIAKADYDIDLIRKWNLLAAHYDKEKHAILAYMDWQGL